LFFIQDSAKIKKPPKDIKSLEASMWYLLEMLGHGALQTRYKGF
jgi:hypothetical protein